MGRKDYILITPARNEEDCIEKTILSVISQSILPKKWIIVSDGSTDATDELAKTYARRFDFLEFVRFEGRCKWGFHSKVAAFQVGYDRIKNVDHRFVGNIDADVSFKTDYFSKILEELSGDPYLGIAGGLVYELIGSKFRAQRISLNSVAGAVQLFQRECFEEIGGYMPLRFGGVDSAAEIMARSMGWKVRTFPEHPIFHHRRVVTGSRKRFLTKIRHGMTHYALGYHPIFEISRCLHRMISRRGFLDNLLVWYGFTYAFLLGQERVLPCEVVEFLRSEQIKRLSKPFHRNLET